MSRAIWDDPKKLGNKLIEGKKKKKPMLLTDNVSIAIDGKNKEYSFNTLVVGAAGTGKTVSYGMPNVLQENMSYIIMDQNKNMYSKVKDTLIADGYDVQLMDIAGTGDRQFDLFETIQTDQDALTVAEKLFSSRNSDVVVDPFWDNAIIGIAGDLLKYIKNELPEKKQTIVTFFKMVDGLNGDLSGETDKLFSDLPEKKKKQYQNYLMVSSSEGLRRTILSLLRQKLHNINFNLKGGSKPVIDISNIYDKKTCIFIDLGQASNTGLAVLIIDQLIKKVYRRADDLNWDFKYRVQFFVDEPYGSYSKDFIKALRLGRTRNVSFTLFAQDMSELIKVYRRSPIFYSFDIILFLGHSSFETKDAICQIINDYFIRDRSDKYYCIGIEAFDGLDPNDCILMVNGERPVIDKKISFRSKKS